MKKDILKGLFLFPISQFYKSVKFQEYNNFYKKRNRVAINPTNSPLETRDRITYG